MILGVEVIRTIRVDWWIWINWWVDGNVWIIFSVFPHKGEW